MSHKITSRKCGRECQLVAIDGEREKKKWLTESGNCLCAKRKPWSLLLLALLDNQLPWHKSTTTSLVIIIFHISHCLHNCYYCLTCARHSNACRSCDWIQTSPYLEIVNDSVCNFRRDANLFANANMVKLCTDWNQRTLKIYRKERRLWPKNLTVSMVHFSNFQFLSFWLFFRLHQMIHR